MSDWLKTTYILEKKKKKKKGTVDTISLRLKACDLLMAIYRSQNK
jgi:hypothetical protein